MWWICFGYGVAASDCEIRILDRGYISKLMHIGLRRGHVRWPLKDMRLLHKAFDKDSFCFYRRKRTASHYFLAVERRVAAYGFQKYYYGLERC